MWADAFQWDGEALRSQSSSASANLIHWLSLKKREILENWKPY